ncbi:MAG TPA: hypothetical protein PLP29_19710 [Candidatus Ozemobacteraceae bacterium]|nr:hypothetical protein [Candidatus Ozemobacteraceae bacterium]
MTPSATPRSLTRDSRRKGADGLATLRPVFELRAFQARDGLELAIWQLPSAATPRLTQAECTAALKGRGLELIETRVLRKLKAAGVHLGSMKAGGRGVFPIDEDTALGIGLLFRALAPMRSIERIRQVADQIEQMNREEAGYWLGMALHRRRPRRVLAALRLLLTS